MNNLGRSPKEVSGKEEGCGMLVEVGGDYEAEFFFLWSPFCVYRENKISRTTNKHSCFRPTSTSKNTFLQKTKYIAVTSAEHTISLNNNKKQ